MISERVDSGCSLVSDATGLCGSCINGYVLENNNCVKLNALKNNFMQFDAWFWSFIILSVIIIALGVVILIITILRLKKEKKQNEFQTGLNNSNYKTIGDNSGL